MLNGRNGRRNSFSHKPAGFSQEFSVPTQDAFAIDRLGMPEGSVGLAADRPVPPPRSGEGVRGRGFGGCQRKPLPPAPSPKRGGGETDRYFTISFTGPSIASAQIS